MDKRFLLFILIFIIFNISNVSAVVINEIMPHSNNSWIDEWVEIYNPTNNIFNLTQWKIGDLKGNDTINNLIIYPNSFGLIVDNNTQMNNQMGCESFNIPNESCIELRAIGNGLKDDNETLYLYDANSNLVDSFSWSTDLKSTGKSWSLYNLNWLPCPPTPGFQNNCSQQGQGQQEKELDLNYDSEVGCDEEFSIEIEAFNFEDGDYDIKIDILDEEDEDRIGKVWDEDEEKWKSTSYYIISALEIENNYGNAELIFKVEDFEGEAILRPKIKETGSNSYEQFSDFSIDIECNIQEESEIDIIDAPEQAKFGEEIEIELEIYRGDTAKYAVYVYVQDSEERKVSDKISLHCDEKFQSYTEIVTLDLNCKNEQGTYEIIAQGLDVEDIKLIELESCSAEEKEEENTETISQSSSLSEKDSFSHITGSVIETESFVFNRILPYILTSVALLLVIYLIIKKI